MATLARPLAASRIKAGPDRIAALFEPALRTWAALIYAFLFLPIGIVVFFSFNASRLVTVWGGSSTRWYAALLEDRTPLVVHGIQVVPSGTNRFKRDGNVIVYSEIYEPLLASENPPKIGLGYRILDRASKKAVMFTGVVAADAFIQKGNPVVPVGLKVNVKDLAPGGYCLILQAVDAAGNKAPNRTVDFDVL